MLEEAADIVLAEKSNDLNIRLCDATGSIDMKINSSNTKVAVDNRENWLNVCK